MGYAIQHIAKTLREARESKGLSQRALGNRAGVPQGHISRIEAGAIDLRLSSLIGLARALDLELALVPRKAVPAVQSIVRATTSGTDERPLPARPAYGLEDDDVA
jgi:transcriptional regulator with XRE-family HTH domain